MRKLILLGGGGHCHSVIDCIDKTVYTICGILDPKTNLEPIDGIEVLGTDDKLHELGNTYSYHITIGMTKISTIREKAYNLLTDMALSIETIISPYAYVAKGGFLDKSCTIMHQALINRGVQIGANTIVNTRALIEHDTIIGKHTHISTGAIINGGCTIGDHCLIGSNATILHGINITSSTIIGAGTVVTSNIYEQGVYVGIPAKRIK